ncbi:calcitonin gene-related peptide type 1 receptor-like isoform X2 [Centruroides vittatus]|uniref:calcitonin gene-related peptide type 1 receptor-like isoform X2 n=1 Tax=Centruroides vittatus TaxID=120091 RepID=UPI00350F2F5A
MLPCNCIGTKIYFIYIFISEIFTYKVSINDVSKMVFSALLTITVLSTQQSENYTSYMEDYNESTASLTSILCRTERGVSLPFDIYRRDTCARCYNYLPSWAFVDTEWRFIYNYRTGALKDPRSNISYLIDPGNSSHPIFDTFKNKVFVSKWIECCRAAVACCQKMLKDLIPVNETLYCPRTWDGWQCWTDTPSGQVAKSVCQEHIYFSSEPPSCPRYAIKTCMPNGKWYLRNFYKTEWTNYNECGRVQGILRLQYFHIATYSISIFFLIPAIFIFIIYKQLQVYRITMHKNLFASLLLNGIFVVLFKSIVMLDELDNFDNTTTILDQNGPGCKFLFIITKYLRMTNYMWMFCEGLYLHRLLSAAFAEQESLVLFYVIGWVFPIIPVAIYAFLRETFANEHCWAMPADPYEWTLNIPNMFSLVLNFAFLCRIIQVLVTKLRAVHANEPSQYRKAVRATLVLVPLFGLHFFLVIYRPQSGGCEMLDAYTFFTYTLDGLQGFLVALIFCYLNGEIQMLVWRSIERYRLQQKLPSSDWKQSNRSYHRPKSGSS